MRTHVVLLVSLAVMALMVVTAEAMVSKPPVVWIPSPNFDEERNCSKASCRPPFTIDSIVIHTTEETFEDTLSLFQNPDSGVSSHYLVHQNGTIVQMVEDISRAWTSTYVNGRSIGIENVGWAGDSESWTYPQLGSLSLLVAYLVQEYSIPLRHPNTTSWDFPLQTEEGYYNESGIYGHFQVQTCGSPATLPLNQSGGGYNCKTDPGPFFPWSSFLSQISLLLSSPILPVETYRQRYDCGYWTKEGDTLGSIQRAYHIPYWQSLCLYNPDSLASVCSPLCMKEGECGEVGEGIHVRVPDVREKDFPECTLQVDSSHSSHDIFDGHYSPREDRRGKAVRVMFVLVVVVGSLGIALVLALFLWRQVRNRNRSSFSLPDQLPDSIDIELDHSSSFSSSSSSSSSSDPDLS